MEFGVACSGRLETSRGHSLKIVFLELSEVYRKMRVGMSISCRSVGFSRTVENENAPNVFGINFVREMQSERVGFRGRSAVIIIKFLLVLFSHRRTGR